MRSPLNLASLTTAVRNAARASGIALAPPMQQIRFTPNDNAEVNSIFTTYNMVRAQEIIMGLNRFSNLARNKKYYQGDHWQDGEGWVGPAPAEGTTDRSTVLGLIQKSFVSKNAIREVVDRHADALLARVDSSWYFVPAIFTTGVGTSAATTVVDTTEPEGDSPTNPDAPSPTADGTTPEPSPAEQLIMDITPVITRWWDRRDVVSVITSAAHNMLWSGRGGIRLFIPTGKLINGQIPPFDTLEEFLELIYLEAPDPDQAATVLDRPTMEEVYVNYFMETDPTTRMRYRYSEIAFVDWATGLTVIKIESDNPNQATAMITIDLNRQNIFFEMKRQPLVTDSVISLQKLLNKALTMLSRNVDVGGFMERVILNADIPGEWKMVGGKKRFVPQPIDVGPARTTVLSSQVIQDDEGRNVALPVDIRYRDPVKTDTFQNTRQEAYTAILEETEQTFALLSADAFASGDARIQARASFATSLSKSKPQVDGLVAWLLNTVLQMAATFSGDPNKYQSIRAVSDLRPDTGPLTPQERTVVINTYKAGLISRETAMVILGVSNPDEELAKIKLEKRITTPMELAAILTALSKTGWSLSWDQLPEVDDNILGLQRRSVQKYIDQLKQEAEMQAPSGGNSGAAGGSPQGDTNKPGSQDPGPSGAGG